ncbi:MAG TPA: hypothetical protein VKW08_18135 [Xanthobacteraceae bacterium]|jgi:hypothetical protein|nr:hypothetical protein [Xanthobacteraceae bacterium]
MLDEWHTFDALTKLKLTIHARPESRAGLFDCYRNLMTARLA